MSSRQARFRARSFSSSSVEMGRDLVVQRIVAARDLEPRGDLASVLRAMVREYLAICGSEPEFADAWALEDRERRAQAARYLAEPGLHLGQIAGLLGYAEQSALNRSCQRWFGKTPRQFRAGGGSIRAEPSDLL